jgi:hypothetical protein
MHLSAPIMNFLKKVATGVVTGKKTKAEKVSKVLLSSDGDRNNLIVQFQHPTKEK